MPAAGALPFLYQAIELAATAPLHAGGLSLVLNHLLAHSLAGDGWTSCVARSSVWT